MQKVILMKVSTKTALFTIISIVTIMVFWLTTQVIVDTYLTQY